MQNRAGKTGHKPHRGNRQSKRGRERMCVLAGLMAGGGVSFLQLQKSFYRIGEQKNSLQSIKKRKRSHIEKLNIYKGLGPLWSPHLNNKKSFYTVEAQPIEAGEAELHHIDVEQILINYSFTTLQLYSLNPSETLITSLQ